MDGPKQKITQRNVITTQGTKEFEIVYKEPMNNFPCNKQNVKHWHIIDTAIKS